MQRRLPEYAQSVTGLCLLMLIAWGTAYTPTVSGGDFLIEADPFDNPSTLDPSVPRQNLLWQSTVKGYLSETGRPTKKPIPSATTLEKLPVTVADRPQSGGKSAPAKTSSSPTPFSKWISPRSSSPARTIPSAEVTPTPRDPRQPANSNQSAEQIPTEPSLGNPRDVPEVARRIISRRQSASQQKSKPPESRRISDVLNQERAPTAAELAEEELNATPLNAYPEPQADSDENSSRDEDEVELVPVKLPPLTNNQKVMRENVRRVLRYYYDHPMNTRDRSPWEMMHAALSYEVHSRVLQGGPQGKPVSAVGWLCFNQSCRRMKLMYIDDEGELNVRVGPALQGHRGQLLAILAQGKVSSEYPMLVDGHELKIKDLIKVEMETCYPRTELTFKLIGLMHYLNSETKWVNDQGMQWNMRKLVSEELAQPIRGAACGGTHRLSGLTLAYKTRQARGERVDGEYAQAQRFVAQHQLYTFRTQNSDGSFSTNWFQGREDENDIDRKLKTTGHMLEWLLYSSTDRELKSSRTTKAVYFLSNLMYQNRYRDWEAGPLGHALHSLVLYDRMMFSKYDSPGDLPMAIRDTTPSGSRGTR